MQRSTSRRPLKVTLQCMSPRNQAVLNFFIANAGREFFQVVGEDQAEAGIFDFDGPEAEKHWRAFHDSRKAPSIVLSVRRHELPDCIWVSKPFSADALIRAAHELAARVPGSPKMAESAGSVKLLQRASAAAPYGRPAAATPPAVDAVARPRPPVTAPGRSWGSGPLATHTATTPPVGQVPPSAAAGGVAIAPVAEVGTSGTAAVEEAAPPQPKPPRHTEPAIAPIDPATVDRYCGTQPEVDLADEEAVERIRYDPQAHLFGDVLDAMEASRRTRRPVRMDLNGGQIFYFPTSDRLMSTLTRDALTGICLERANRAKSQTHILNTKEASQVEDEVMRADVQTEGEALLWELALLTAQGRLPHEVDVHKPLALRHWPNLTRVTWLPDGVRIAALWHERPSSLNETVEVLKVPQRHVFAFYSGAAALGLVDHNVVVKRSLGRLLGKHRLRSVFSSLLKRLRGG